jgi:glutamine synthetase
MNTVEYFKAKQELTLFLRAHPELAPFQAEIDRRLNAAANSHNRMLVLKKMIDHTTQRLHMELQNLEALADKLPKP